MKLFKSLLVAPATLGLLAPLSATANEVTINDFNPAEELAVTNSRVDGLEARLNNFEAGGFSETTSASFSVDAVIGAIDGDTTSEATVFEYQYNIGLSTSFTGEDSLDIAIDSGSDSAATADNPFSLDTGSSLQVDGVTYSFPLGGVSMVVGADTDISASFTGACSYSAFTDYMGDCGTGNTIGKGGNGVTATGSYGFDSGFSVAAGISSKSDSGDGILTKEGTDSYGLEAAYTADSWGVAVAYVSDDNAAAAETTSWGANATYSFESADVSVGYETQETSGADSSGYFVGLTFPEVGPGSVSVGMATAGNFAEGASELMTYEASYSYPVNDAMTITPGIFIEETAVGSDDLTGIFTTVSFSF
jgi:hypothetical protein